MVTADAGIRGLAQLATAAGPPPDRARRMLELLRTLVPFDAAWVAVLDDTEYTSLSSRDLDDAVVRWLSGPVMARDIELLGTDRAVPPVSPSDLPYPAEDLSTWSDCLLPAGLNEALATGLFEPGGRHVGFLAVLSADTQPPSTAQRSRLAAASGLIAQIVDPMASVAAAARLVGDATAGVLLLDGGGRAPLPGLPDDALLWPGSPLLRTLATMSTGGAFVTAFVWPRVPHASAHDLVRVTSVALAGSSVPGVHSVVLLSPPGDLRGLTTRELEVLGLVVEGCSNDQIARRLVVTPRTVATHVEHVLAKLGSPSRTHAAVQAQREGLYVPLPCDGGR